MSGSYGFSTDCNTSSFLATHFNTSNTCMALWPAAIKDGNKLTSTCLYLLMVNTGYMPLNQNVYWPKIYNLHIVLTCPFVLSAIYCEQVEKQVVEFSFSSILHTDTGLCQSSLVSSIKPIVHSKAPKPKVFAPPTLLVSKTPATRGAQELSNFTRVLLVVTRNYVWIMLPIVVSVTNPPAIILPHHKERPGTAISPSMTPQLTKKTTNWSSQIKWPQK